MNPNEHLAPYSRRQNPQIMVKMERRWSRPANKGGKAKKCPERSKDNMVNYVKQLNGGVTKPANINAEMAWEAICLCLIMVSDDILQEV